MAAGLEVCEEIIRNSSPKQMFDAFAESATRIYRHLSKKGTTA